MKIVLQRVSQASVTVNKNVTGSIGKGLLLLVGIHEKDTEAEMKWMCEKILNLRVFDDENGKMNYSASDINGELLIVSQFTLYGDARKGNRPSYVQAAGPDKAEELYDQMIEYFKNRSDLKVETGKFGVYMDVELNNDGPVTIILEK